jgi:hydrogenase maturation protease
MNRALVDQIVHAVLYEGYILYPYRASARKNRQRFTFGRVYPESYSIAQKGAEPCAMQTECLVESQSPQAALEVIVRFLHPMARDVGALATPLSKLPEADDADFFQMVPELEIEGKLHQSWQETVEREVHAPLESLSAIASRTRTIPFSFPASRAIEPIVDRQGQIAAVILRRQAAVEGQVEISAEAIDAKVFKVTVRILNRSAVPEAQLNDQEAVIMRTFASTHTILHAHDALFLSQIDPPPAYAATVAACRQLGTWPILVGDEEKKERGTMVSSPIILYDYPKIAPESPGDLFDSGEIDEILTLRIMTMTDEEKREMRGVDAQARRILERTESMSEGQILQMHGVMRGTPSSGEDFFNPATRLQSVSVNGVSLKTGDRVRVRPKSRADVMDIALDGKIAVIEAIEQDAEDKAHLALVMEDDPGKDLGFLRQPGHRFFYGTDEIELLREGE